MRAQETQRVDTADPVCPEKGTKRGDRGECKKGDGSSPDRAGPFYTRVTRCIVTLSADGDDLNKLLDRLLGGLRKLTPVERRLR
ncbi:hypothetical protein BHM03_00009286 [Ensete ventricosum]|uniref:Uncharacterized protein n=1 Tax=Ensete ventricosum TaxID=4639 RepID=A0A445MCL1_ENSVE|nr:hypothetical protein BHM03_00009286 [Ensete ventricosum]